MLKGWWSGLNHKTTETNTFGAAFGLRKLRLAPWVGSKREILRFSEQMREMMLTSRIFWALSNARNPLVCAKNGRLHATVRADLPLTTLFAESAHARRDAAPQAPGETNTDENENY